MEIVIQSELFTRAQETLVMLETIRENITTGDNPEKITTVTD